MSQLTDSWIHAALVLRTPGEDASCLSRDWRPSWLQRLDASGAPARPFFAWLEEEFPPPVFEALVRNRRHIDFWDAPIQLAHKAEVVALELVESVLPDHDDLLVVHLRCPDNPTRLAHLSNSLVSTRKAHRELMTALGISPAHSSRVTRGFGIAARPVDDAGFQMSMTGGLTIVAGIEPKQLHGRFTLIAMLVALQYLGVRDVQELWASSDARQRKDAEPRFAELDRKYLWDEVTHHLETRELYSFMRTQLALPGSEQQMRQRMLAEYERQQARSASTLNRLAAVLGLSGVVAAWAAADEHIGHSWSATGFTATMLCALLLYAATREK